MKTRKLLRLKDYDYDQEGAYHIIICSENRGKIFSEVDINNGSVILKNLGNITEDTINYYINNIDNSIEIITYSIMPNHIHILLMLSKSDSKCKKNRISKFIASIKRYTNKEAGKNIWQRGFYDHVIRDEKDFLTTIQYIDENPLKWAEDEYYKDDKF